MSSQSESAIRNGSADPNGPEPIAPIPLDGQGLPARRNVQKWLEEAEKDSDAALELSLFIRAMTKFQALEPHDQLSYFRIAGIHGLPENVSWNMSRDPISRDDPDFEDKIKAGLGGFYCMHNQYRFGTWHRVYMMLFERRFSDLMKEEAKAMKIENDQDRFVWEAAAARWRLPYWDWALDSRLPELVCKKDIDIVSGWNAATGTADRVPVHNPMYRFRMPGGKAMGDESYGDYRITPADGLPFDLCEGTSRHAISWYTEKKDWIEGVTNVEQANTALEHPEWSSKAPETLKHDTIKDVVQRLLNPDYNVSFEQFISTKYVGQKDDPKEYISLEALHNNIHNWTGGSDATQAGGAGHMSSVPVAAFDPVFWLHHCNIDRIIYLWQTIPGNREKWFNPADDNDKDHDGAKAPLLPFRCPEKPADFYDSDKVRLLSELNYTYDDIVIQSPATPDDPPSLTLPFDMPFSEALPRAPQLAKRINGLYGKVLPDVSDTHGAEEVDFIVNVRYNRFALGGLRYTIRFTLAGDRIGSVHTFSSPIRSGANGGAIRCAECAKQAANNTLSRAQVPILRAVRFRVPPEEGESADAYKQRVDEYLQENLSWVAVLDSGAGVPKMALGEVEVEVLAGRFEARRRENEWVRFGGHVPLEGMTGKL